MAQTISAARGNQSVANNSVTSIYTNSSSGSSRVIINGLTIFGTGGGTTLLSALYIRNSSGGNDLVVAAYCQNGTGRDALVWVPGSIPVGAVNSVNGQGMYGMVFNTGVDNSVAVDGLQWNWSGTSFVNQFHYCPKNIWLGPSDQLIFRAKSGNTSNMTLVYNFTVITET